MGGGLGGGRASGGRMSGSLGGSLGRGGAARGGASRPVARPAPPRRNPGFTTGVGVGMGMGMMAGGGRRRRGWGMGGGWGGGWGWGRRRRMPMGGMGMGMGMPMGRRRGGCGSGCMGVIMAIIMLIIVLSVISMVANFAMPAVPVGGRTQVTRSTVNRTALPRDAADTSVTQLVDLKGWIGNTAILNRGMTNFHNRTGVRPILYITSEIDGNVRPTFAQLSAYANRRYAELTGGCEAHMLLVIFQSERNLDDYGWYIVRGAQARTVIDEEAYNIVLDYVARYWYNQRLENHEVFSRAFDESSERIMRVDRSPWIPVLIVAGILLILALLYRWWQKKQEQKNLEAEQLERVLNQPLETMGDSHDEAARRAQQYEDDNNPTN